MALPQSDGQSRWVARGQVRYMTKEKTAKKAVRKAVRRKGSTTARPPRESSRARKVLSQARDSTKGFLDAFDKVREARGATVGSTTDEEQDLLRATLVFAAAGLDSSLKELIRGSIRSLAAVDPDVQRELEVFVQRQLRGDLDEPDAPSGRKFLARVLVATSPQDRLIADYTTELTGTSLQSAQQLVKAAKALGLDPTQIGIAPNDLQPIFDVRNKIIHELDVNLERTSARRNRNSRRREDMDLWSRRLLDIAEALVVGVETRLERVS